MTWRAVAAAKGGSIFVGFLAAAVCFLALFSACVYAWVPLVLPFVSGKPLAFAAVYELNQTDPWTVLKESERIGSWHPLMRLADCSPVDLAPQNAILCHCFDSAETKRPASPYNYEEPIDEVGDPDMWTEEHTKLASQCLLHTQNVASVAQRYPISVLTMLLVASAVNLVFFLYYIGMDARTRRRRVKSAGPSEEVSGLPRAVFFLCSAIPGGSAFGEFVVGWTIVLSLAVSVCSGLVVWGTMAPLPDSVPPGTASIGFPQGVAAGLFCCTVVVVVFLLIPEPRYRTGMMLYSMAGEIDQGQPDKAQIFASRINDSALATSVGYVWHLHLLLSFPLWACGWQILLGSRQTVSLLSTFVLSAVGAVALLPCDFMMPLLTLVYKPVHKRHKQFSSAGAMAAGVLMLDAVAVACLCSAVVLAAPLAPATPPEFSLNGGGELAEMAEAAKRASLGVLPVSRLYWIATSLPAGIAAVDTLLFLFYLPSFISQGVASHRYATNLAADRPVKPMLYSVCMAVSSVLLLSYL